MELFSLEIGGFPPSIESWGISVSPGMESRACSGEEIVMHTVQDTQKDQGARWPLLEAEVLWSHHLARI